MLAFLLELAPEVGRVPPYEQLLAGIPSIIYGIWGLFILAPFLQQTLQPFLIATLGNVPILSSLFEGPPIGTEPPLIVTAEEEEHGHVQTRRLSQKVGIVKRFPPQTREGKLRS